MAVKRKTKVDPLPEAFPSLEAAAQFWDAHDLTDYLAFARPVNDIQFHIEKSTYLVAIEPALARKLSKAAQKRGMTKQALANLWIREKLKAERSQ